MERGCDAELFRAYEVQKRIFSLFSRRFRVLQKILNFAQQLCFLRLRKIRGAFYESAKPIRARDRRASNPLTFRQLCGRLLDDPSRTAFFRGLAPKPGPHIFPRPGLLVCN
jgi:hypothetical protein